MKENNTTHTPTPSPRQWEFNKEEFFRIAGELQILVKKQDEEKLFEGLRPLIDRLLSSQATQVKECPKCKSTNITRFAEGWKDDEKLKKIAEKLGEQIGHAVKRLADK